MTQPSEFEQLLERLCICKAEVCVCGGDTDKRVLLTAHNANIAAALDRLWHIVQPPDALGYKFCETCKTDAREGCYKTNRLIDRELAAPSNPKEETK